MTDQAPDTGELTYTRVFDAPRELVFRCMLEPEHLTHFWGPAGVSTPLETIKVDARPVCRDRGTGADRVDRTRLRRDDDLDLP